MRGCGYSGLLIAFQTGILCVRIDAAPVGRLYPVTVSTKINIDTV